MNAFHLSTYQHTQHGKFHYLLYAIALAMIAGGWLMQSEPAAMWISFATAGVLALVTLSFHYLSVTDEEDQLRVQFGPLPLMGKKLAYREIAAVKSARSRVIDGWGVHWVPGRGWTYNLWGFDCVELTLTDGRTVRIGTDDPQGLESFLHSKLAPSGSPAALVSEQSR